MYIHIYIFRHTIFNIYTYIDICIPLFYNECIAIVKSKNP